ncbi:chaplin [Streptomyces sp. NPDC053048]|uniref:chaplin n=1 Tax=Streptomyces sp. NPDC053048 TaxID=3365694 RepID=UPI0037D0865D
MNSAKKAALALAAAGVALGASVVPAMAHDDDGFGGALASGAAKGSPGFISGNVIQVPIAIPINICGNSIDIVGLLNPTFGNTCVNDGHHGGGHHDGGHHNGGHHDGGYHHGGHHDGGHHGGGHHDGGHHNGGHH